MGIVMLNPTVGPSKARNEIPALGSLEGIRLGLLDNSKNNVAALLKAIGARLMEGHGVVELQFDAKPVYARPATAAQLDSFAGCGGVLTAVGD